MSANSYGLGVSGFIQLWATAMENGEGPGVEAAYGAEVRRLRVSVTGHVLGPDNRLILSVGTPSDERLGPEPSDFGIVDAYIGFHQLRDMEVRVGRQLVPFLREWIVSAPAGPC